MIAIRFLPAPTDQGQPPAETWEAWSDEEADQLAADMTAAGGVIVSDTLSPPANLNTNL